MVWILGIRKPADVEAPFPRHPMERYPILGQCSRPGCILFAFLPYWANMSHHCTGEINIKGSSAKLSRFNCQQLRKCQKNVTSQHLSWGFQVPKNVESGLSPSPSGNIIYLFNYVFAGWQEVILEVIHWNVLLCVNGLFLKDSLFFRDFVVVVTILKEIIKLLQLRG